MPYIKQPDREPFDNILQHLRVPSNAGELNYVLTRIALAYVDANGGRYQQFNDVLGAFEGAKLELYRRQVAPYEDVKIVENGDV